MYFKNFISTLDDCKIINESVGRILKVNSRLKVEEAIAIAQYIGPYRRKINQYLLGSGYEPWVKDCHFHLNNALNNKLSKFNLNLILKRDIKVENIEKFILANQIFEGIVYESDHFMAFTYDLSFDLYLGNVQFICKPSKNGKSRGVEMDLYKRNSVEHEVLYPLGTKFLVEKIKVGRHTDLPKRPKYKLRKQASIDCYNEFLNTRSIPKYFSECPRSDIKSLEKIFNTFTQDVAFIYLKEVGNDK